MKSFYEVLAVTLNASILAVMYTIFGGLVSYVFYHVFDEFDENWKKKSLFFKIADVTIEISIVAIIAFWSSRFTERLPAFFPVRKELDRLVDGYISGIFYIFAIFLFMDQLTDKLKYLHEENLGTHFEKLLPQHGSLIDLSLSYTPKRTEHTNNSEL
jgi:hypothetical protein